MLALQMQLYVLARFDLCFRFSDLCWTKNAGILALTTGKISPLLQQHILLPLYFANEERNPQAQQV
jgi:hypothetical protein